MLFAEEVVRGGPAFAVSLVLSSVEPMLRNSAALGAWQVCGWVKGGWGHLDQAEVGWGLRGRGKYPDLLSGLCTYEGPFTPHTFCCVSTPGHQPHSGYWSG